MPCPRRTLLLLCLSLSVQRAALAHHAKEYLRTESFGQTPQWGVALFSGFDYYRPRFSEPRADTWELTPTLAFGLHDRLMLDAHGHLLKVPGADPFVEAMAVALQGQLTAPGSWLLDVALALQYEAPFPRSQQLVDGRHNLGATLILARELRYDINVTSNLSYTRFFGEGGWNEFGYALATKGHVIPPLGWLEGGLEAFGSVGGRATTLSLLPGLYIAPLPHLVVKVGFSFGLTRDTESFGAHVVVAVSFAPPRSGR